MKNASGIRGTSGAGRHRCTHRHLGVADRGLWCTSLSISVPLCLCGSLFAGPPEKGQYFQIKVIDEQTGRGVPLVELSTTHNLRLYTDSNGVVAFHEPGLLDQDVYFHVKSHGYEYPQDGFGNRGRAFRVTAGGSAELKVKRINIAERLYRITGGGIYRDSALLGLPVPLEKSVLNGLVFGSDSVLRRCTGESCSGCGATPTARPIRWATSTPREQPQHCRALADWIPTLA